MNSELSGQLDAALADGNLLQSSHDNITELLSSDNPIYEASVAELAERQEWAELNNRFFKKLAFGTGGPSWSFDRRNRHCRRTRNCG